MKGRFTAVFLTILFVLQSLFASSYAQNESGKVILIMLNRTGMEDILEIKSIKEELDSRGYVSLMNIKGSKGTSDIRSYASIGWGTRAYLKPEDIDFVTSDDENSVIFKRRTGIEPKNINNININMLKSSNESGEYGAYLGILQKELSENGKTISVIGNSNIPEQNRSYASLLAMDENGSIESGKIDGINVQDDYMPFGMRTDYEALKEHTRDYYSKSDVLAIELGDTGRLDLYRENLNQKTYGEMHNKIYGNISDYISYVMSELADSRDRIYIVSPYPTLLEYKNYKRLSPAFIFEGQGKGVLYSNTTRREGVIGNVDIAADVLDYFGIKSDFMVGRSIQKIERSDNTEFLRSEFEKMSTTYQLRMPVLYSYAVFEMLLWISIFICILIKGVIPKKAFGALSEVLQLTVVMPFVLLVEPIFRATSISLVLTIIISLTVILYIALKKLVKGNIERFMVISIMTGIGILADAATGQELIKRSIFGYDAMIGARYYGVGNEYMGILIGASLLSVAGLLQKKKIKKTAAIIMLAITIVILGFPKMGANVGGTITASFCFLFFVLRMYNVKIDFKKLIAISAFVCVVVAGMAFIDIFLIGSKSHLAGAIQSIISGGPVVILQIISRKLAMNASLIGGSIWSKVFIMALFIVGVLFYRPFGILKRVCNEKEFLKKGWISIIVGSFVGFAVNDSGVVSAATSISFVIISVLLLIMEKIAHENGQQGS